MRGQATENTLTSRRAVTPLRLALDDHCDVTLRDLFLRNLNFFDVVTPSDADLVILPSDDPTYIKNSRLYHENKKKTICITESDIPTFLLPGLYAANQKGLLTAGRTQTINYLISERAKPNPEIKALAGRTIEKRYLYSFMGGTNSWPRRWLFRYTPKRDDTIVEPTDNYNHWKIDETDVEERARLMRQRYAEVMAASKYAICPRGCGLSSYRLFESMSLGVAPVIISDKWRPIAGIDWSFAIFIREKDIPKLDQIVRSHESEWQHRGKRAKDAYTEFLGGDAIAQTLHAKLSELRTEIHPWREFLIRNAAMLRIVIREAYWAGYSIAKKFIIKIYAAMGFSLPFRVYQPRE